MPKPKKRAFRGNKYVKLRASIPAPDAATTSSADAPDNTTSTTTTRGDHHQQSSTTTASSAKLSASMLENSNLVSGLKSSSPDSVLMQTNLILDLLTRLANNSILCFDHPESKLSISVVPVCGIVCSFQFHCSNCNVLLEDVVTSDHDSSNSRYSLNTRLAFGTVLAGGHRSTAETITAHLGLLPPVVPSEWSKDMTRLNNVTKTHATESVSSCQGSL